MSSNQHTESNLAKSKYETERKILIRKKVLEFSGENV